MEEKRRKLPFGIFSSLLNENLVHCYRIYTVEGDRLYACFYILILYYSGTIKFEKFVRTCFLVAQTENFK